jgi:hypothetical protein
MFERAFDLDMKRILDPLRGVDAAVFDVERSIDRTSFLIARDQAWHRESAYARAVAHASGLHPSRAHPTEAAVDRAFAECHRNLVISLHGPIEVLRRSIPPSWQRSALSDLLTYQPMFGEKIQARPTPSR